MRCFAPAVIVTSGSLTLRRGSCGVTEAMGGVVLETLGVLGVLLLLKNRPLLTLCAAGARAIKAFPPLARL